ncbi:hypothetical protein [Bacillus sp. S/N-304-OC-R1]|uniref:hypothetical protein n=1 Tax=Bacillus sp. S/N-304-OC-R1 TaxID=2758034 RepID=UPI001C8CF7E8|nr:hypothetical protein [Bacillus sp. S/N-304-OC-R1]MBY0122311.1 hypothetical protein [Bacillus sp. S/N-304-OC-R1]
MTREIMIQVDKITSGKNNIISFVRKGKQIDTAPLKLKSLSEVSQYDFNHHFDKEDLERLNTMYPSIYPNSSDKDINNWAEDMKKAFKNLIETGEFDRTYNHNGETVMVKYIWVNE